MNQSEFNAEVLRRVAHEGVRLCDGHYWENLTADEAREEYHADRRRIERELALELRDAKKAQREIERTARAEAARQACVLGPRRAFVQAMRQKYGSPVQVAADERTRARRSRGPWKCVYWRIQPTEGGVFGLWERVLPDGRSLRISTAGSRKWDLEVQAYNANRDYMILRGECYGGWYIAAQQIHRLAGVRS